MRRASFTSSNNAIAHHLQGLFLAPHPAPIGQLIPAATDMIEFALGAGHIGPGRFVARRGLVHSLNEPVPLQVRCPVGVLDKARLTAQVKLAGPRADERPRRPVHHRASPYSPPATFLTRKKPFHLMTLPPTYTLPRCATWPLRNLYSVERCTSTSEKMARP